MHTYTPLHAHARTHTHTPDMSCKDVAADIDGSSSSDSRRISEACVAVEVDGSSFWPVGAAPKYFKSAPKFTIKIQYRYNKLDHTKHASVTQLK